MEASYYKKRGNSIHCTLCPHHCVIRDGNSGICRVRRNEKGILIADSYGRIAAIHMDPIEKKPLYHFFPGQNILSLGSVGCNMRCGCCQNWQISQVSISQYDFEKTYTPHEIIEMASRQEQNLGIAYTYNEPSVWFEFMRDTARLASLKGLKNVMVSNGYIDEEPLQELLLYIDAFNIDLKAFTGEFYIRQTGATLPPVLQAIKTIRRAGRHLELTYLVIPTLNDRENEFREMTAWISGELGPDTVLHLSRYHPMYKMNIEPTSSGNLEYLYGIAREKLHYVYIGNVQTRESQDTFCGNCKARVIVRSGYQTEIISLGMKGECTHCGNSIIKSS